MERELHNYSRGYHLSRNERGDLFYFFHTNLNTLYKTKQVHGDTMNVWWVYKPQMAPKIQTESVLSETMRLNIGGSTFEDEGTLMKIS